MARTRSYLLQLDKNAISGDVTVQVTNGMTGDTANVTWTPAYYPGGGVINPARDRRGDSERVELIAERGNELATPSGPIQVRLLSAGEITASLGTPWDITPAPVSLDPTQLIYEITFTGEVHDAPMSLVVTASTLTLAPAATGSQQDLTFLTNGSGYYQLGVNGQLTNTYFDASIPAAMAGTIAGILQGMVPAGVTVACDLQTANGPPYTYLVTFSAPQSQIAVATASPAYSPLLAPLPSVKMLGLPAAFPLTDCQTYGDNGTDQYNASMAMGDGGNFVMVWNQDAQYNDGAVATTNLYFRTFQESTDTAGPLVTDFLLPTGGAAPTRG